MTFTEKFSIGLRCLIGIWIIYQAVNNLYVLSNQTRENQCSDTVQIQLDIFESSTGALRSNNPVSALSGVLTSLTPFIVLYLVPVFEILYHRYYIEGITADGIVFWFIALMNTIAKYSWREPRPDAYRLCIKDQLSYGQPSGHAMLSVGIWSTCFILFLLYLPPKIKNEDNVNVPFRSWVYNSIFVSNIENKWLRIFWIILLDILLLFNIPFVRYDLQYHTILQILTGMGLGLSCGIVWGSLLNKISRFSEYTGMRTLFCALWAIVKITFDPSHNLVPLVPLIFEMLLFGYQSCRPRHPTSKGYQNPVELATNVHINDKNDEWNDEWSDADEAAWQDAILEKPAKIFF